MDLDKEIKLLKERGPENPLPISKMAAIMAATLDQFTTNQVSKIFLDKNFRKLANFDNLEKVEQDRIFNELVLAGITLSMITLEAPDLEAPEAIKDYYLMVKDQIPKVHINYLKSLGIERKYLLDWGKLISMRYQEYNEDRHKARETAMDLESRENNLTPDKLKEIQLLLPVQTVTIGCHHHICRQKTEDRDELFKLTLKWLSQVYLEIRVRLEGGNITMLGRIRMKIRHLLNKIKNSISS